MDDSPRQLPGVHKIKLVQVNADSFCRLASNTDAQVDPSLQSPSDKTAKNSRQDAKIANFLLSRPTSPPTQRDVAILSKHHNRATNLKPRSIRFQCTMVLGSKGDFCWTPRQILVCCVLFNSTTVLFWSFCL